MNWNDALFQVISLHTFSSVWYWLAMAVTWSMISHWILGVPFDMIFRAKRYGGEAEADLEVLVALNVRRLNNLSEVAGIWILGFASFVLSALFTAGFLYDFELAQGLFLLAMPMSVTGLITTQQSRRFATKQPAGQALCAALLRIRFWFQVIAVFSIFVTAMFGMYRTLSLPLGY